MAALRRIGGLVLGMFYVAPWAWVLTVAVMIALAVAQFDHFPSYGNPDPKWIEGVFVFYWSIYFLFLPSVFSPLVVGAETVVRLVRKTGVRIWPLVGYTLAKFRFRGRRVVFLAILTVGRVLVSFIADILMSHGKTRAILLINIAWGLVLVPAVYLGVRLAPHPRYRVEGRDITAELRLAPWEAALGTSVAIDTPGGEAKVRVPPGTSSGRRLRLRGRGLPNPRGNPGDLYAEARIMVPSRLSDDERRLF